MGKLGVILIMVLAAALAWFVFIPMMQKSGSFLWNVDYSQVR